MSIILAGAAESAADFAVIAGLVDRAIAEGVHWVEDGIAHFRTWANVDGRPFLDLHRARDLACERRFRIYGRFQGEPGAEDALMHRCALLVLADLEPVPAAVVIARDDDGRPTRHEGLDQATDDREWPFAILGALATPEIDAWLVCAFVPRTEDERQRHAEIHRILGFDPIANSHRLTSTGPSRKDAKDVRISLAGNRAEGLARFEATSLDHMRRQGVNNGLTPFLKAVEQKLLPLFGGRPPAS